MYTSENQKYLFELSKQLIESGISVDSDTATNHISELSKVINYHEWRYYVLDQPVLSDYEYDTLFRKLQLLEQEYPQLLQRKGNEMLIQIWYSSDN